MRIVAGKFRSRQLVAPKGWKTRPTSDRLRETLFNVLAPRIQGAIIADLFAGTGAIGLEALSRGANRVYFAETSGPALEALRTNLRQLEVGPEGVIEASGTLALLERLATQGVILDMVFLDPPYVDEKAYTSTLCALAQGTVLSPKGLVIAEHASRVPLPTRYGDLHSFRTIVQGDASLTFFSFSR